MGQFLESRLCHQKKVIPLFLKNKTEEESLIKN